ncbi:MAG: Uncharacterised protein [Methanobacteriota archaeon]|nr:MAG: Uncharacterised protein [Euryarchaeota archaeon]
MQPRIGGVIAIHIRLAPANQGLGSVASYAPALKLSNSEFINGLKSKLSGSTNIDSTTPLDSSYPL